MPILVVIVMKMAYKLNKLTDNFEIKYFKQCCERRTPRWVCLTSNREVHEAYASRLIFKKVFRILYIIFNVKLLMFDNVSIEDTWR